MSWRPACRNPCRRSHHSRCWSDRNALSRRLRRRRHQGRVAWGRSAAHASAAAPRAASSPASSRISTVTSARLRSTSSRRTRAAALDRLLRTADVFIANVRPAALERLGLAARSHCARATIGSSSAISLAFGDDGPYATGLPTTPSSRAWRGSPPATSGRWASRASCPWYSPITSWASSPRNAFSPRFISASGPEKAGDRGADVREHGRLRARRASWRPQLSFRRWEKAATAACSIRWASRSRPRTAISASPPTPTRRPSRLFDAIGRPELKSDPRFCSVKARYANVREYFQIQADGFRERTTAQWLEILEKADVPAGRVHSFESLTAGRASRDRSGSSARSSIPSKAR